VSLREDEIVRYSRQILLREIGGRGQERLLATAVELGGGGAALATAAAYVAASGIRVLGARRWMNASEAGFLVGLAHPTPAEEGQVAAVRSTQASVWIAEAPAEVPDVKLARVLIGSTGSSPGQIVFGSPITDVELLRYSAPTGPVSREVADEVGALAALVVQRLVLGLGDGAGLLRIDRSGAVNLTALQGTG
jgi:hypothetical protein